MIGQTVSHYRILEKLGEGGMGVVYKAEDTRLKRTVALKFLPTLSQKQETGRARFLQEAEAAAKLSHPNICAIHDICDYQDADTGETQQFIVMDFVDGTTLREKMPNIDRKRAIDIGIQMAEGLAAAHEHGVVHRDIKPENIMVRKDGIVQIMDFGLARLKGVRRITKEGSTAGTTGYMSPEQVQGEGADHRSDVFSLGVLLYELFTGELPFRGAHESAILYEIVNVGSPPMSSITPDIDPELDRIVFECLQKEPDERYQAAKDISRDLKRFKRDSSRERASKVFPATREDSAEKTPSAVRALGRPRRRFLPWAIAAMFAFATIALLIIQFTRVPDTRHAIVSSLVPPESIYVHSFGGGAGSPVISPDGQHVAFVGLTPEGVTKIFVHSLRTGSTRVLEGTEGASYPFWSPDGKAIGFFTWYSLRRIDVSGGQTLTILENAVAGRGGAWNQDNTILVGMGANQILYRVSASGGAPEPVTHLDSSRQEGSHRWPVFLPDGRHFLYFARTVGTSGKAEGDAAFVGSLDGKLKTLLVYTSANVAYAQGYLLFVRGSTLMAQTFDAGSLEVKGDAVPIAEGVLNDPNFNLAVFSASNNGNLVYQCGTAHSLAPLSVFGQDGRMVSRFGEGLENWYPRFSPDGERISAGVYDTRTRRANIWIYDLGSGSRLRFAGETDLNQWSVWSPDGSRMLFTSQHDTSFEMFVQMVGKGEGARRLFSSEGMIPLDWSPDNRRILIARTRWPRMTHDLWFVSPDSGNTRELFVGSESNEYDGRFSPDGKWVAYVSDETGEDEIYVKSTEPESNRSWKISSSGGSLPRWGRGGNVLYFLTKENRITSATLRIRDKAVEVTGVRPLFSAPAFTADYDFSRAKGLFVFSQAIVPQKTFPITLVVHWDALARRE